MPSWRSMKPASQRCHPFKRSQPPEPPPPLPTMWTCMSMRRGLVFATVSMDAEALRFQGAESIIFAAMELDYDVVIVGGAFSGAATALMLKRKHPTARILIIEKAAEFDRKVGESTTELSSCYMTRLLGLTNYLGHHHLAKQGLRMWFANRPDQPFDDCVELGARYQSRLPTFQVDRSTLDQHMLDMAVEAGCDLQRPAKVTALELGSARSHVSYETYASHQRVSTRWLVDASGRAAMLARKLGHFQQNTEHPINAVWARFTGVKDWDSYEWRGKIREEGKARRARRNRGAKQLMGPGWGGWVISVRGGGGGGGGVF